MAKKLVPAEAAARIVRAIEASKVADAEKEAAIAQALKDGASVREVAALTGMSTTTVQRIGRAHGWPTDAQQRAWAAEKAERERWAAVVEEYRRTGRAPGSPTD